MTTYKSLQYYNFCAILLLLLGTNLSTASEEKKINLRGLQVDGDEDCIPPKYFSNAGSGKPLKSFKIIAAPDYVPGPKTGNSYITTNTIGGDKKGYPEKVFQSFKYPWDGYMKYIFDTCTDGQEYTVTLGFADVQYNCGDGRYSRIMDIKVNGELFAEELNLEEQVGCNNAYVITGNFFPINETIEIEFEKSTLTSLKPIVSFVSVEPVVPVSRRHLKECPTKP